MFLMIHLWELEKILEQYRLHFDFSLLEGTIEVKESLPSLMYATDIILFLGDREGLQKLINCDSVEHKLSLTFNGKKSEDITFKERQIDPFLVQEHEMGRTEI